LQEKLKKIFPKTNWDLSTMKKPQNGTKGIYTPSYTHYPPFFGVKTVWEKACQAKHLFCEVLIKILI